MTVELRDLRRVVEVALRDCGFEGARNSWQYSGSDMRWLVGYEKPPWFTALHVQVGADIDAPPLDAPRIKGVDSAQLRPPPGPLRANDCVISVPVENFVGLDRYDLATSLYLRSGLDLATRRRNINDGFAALHEYLCLHGSRALVSAALDRGDFRGGFVRRDVRQLLSRRPTV
ncbi:hypothetical protein [Occultella kanbiaonis]|uniref:hypothetical protein n=1 Tax=Occultella kanbiaonis TaxID=2675754 RepID=UPI0012B94904|nr:hypothetical protein [Occultella kanbiaonis]